MVIFFFIPKGFISIILSLELFPALGRTGPAAELPNDVMGNPIGTSVQAQSARVKFTGKFLAGLDLLYVVIDSFWNWLLSFTLRAPDGQVFCRNFSTFVIFQSCRSSALHAHRGSIKVTAWLTVFPLMPRRRDLQSVSVCSCHSDQRIEKGSFFFEVSFQLL